jgi:hypothetical protein
MKETMDHSAFEQWLDLELDGGLAEDERVKLAEHRRGCDRCREAERTQRRLVALLTDARVPVREGFRRQVLVALPVAPWAPARVGVYRWPLALAAAFLAAALGLGALGGGLASGGSVFGSAAALGRLLSTALLAGGGLLAASWKGTGLVVEHSLRESPGGVAALVVLVVGLHLLFFSLVRRRRSAALPGRR